MKKLLIAIVAVIITVTSVNAQNNSSFSLGAELALPVGLFGDVYSFGYGASGQGNFGIGTNAAITAYAGYINYSLKSTYGSGSQGHIPVLGGVEFGFSPAVFGSAQLGLTFYTKGGGSAFTYSPGIGFRLSKNFSALLKYVGQSKAGATSSAVGLRVAYAFGK
ncbi:MAG TPA: hypothetical protein VMY77_11780 [Chitinophagaceae bacterium]|nr:hypothetical protein [Chitinophagaceae bacterium]